MRKRLVFPNWCADRSGDPYLQVMAVTAAGETSGDPMTLSPKMITLQNYLIIQLYRDIRVLTEYQLHKPTRKPTRILDFSIFGDLFDRLNWSIIYLWVCVFDMFYRIFQIILI